MIQNDVDAGPRDQDGQPLQQFEGIEKEVRGAIRPRVPELQHDLPLGRQTEPVLRDGWPQRVPTEPLKTVCVAGRDPQVDALVEGSDVDHRGRAATEDLHLRRVAAFVAHDHGPNPSRKGARMK
jgi:hypothetical protein